MLRYKQSSLWLRRYGKRRFRYSTLPLGILFNASVSLEMSGNFCGHTGPKCSAIFTPDHNAPVTGGINLRLPVGGDAYGIPRNTSTGSKCLLSNVTITPLTSPYFVLTVLELKVADDDVDDVDDEDDDAANDDDDPVAAASLLTITTPIKT
jgi:hypothetical protein